MTKGATVHVAEAVRERRDDAFGGGSRVCVGEQLGYALHKPAFGDLSEDHGCRNADAEHDGRAPSVVGHDHRHDDQQQRNQHQKHDEALDLLRDLLGERHVRLGIGDFVVLVDGDLTERRFQVNAEPVTQRTDLLLRRL